MYYEKRVEQNKVTKLTQRMRKVSAG